MKQVTVPCVIALLLILTPVAVGEELPQIGRIHLKDFQQPVGPAVPRQGVLRRPRMRPGYEELADALRSSWPHAAMAHLAMGADPDAADESGTPVLFSVIRRGKVETVNDFLRAGANPNGKDAYGRTPLHYAVSHGSVEVVRLLLKYGASTRLLNKNGEPPLHNAIRRGDLPVLSALLEAGAHPGFKTPENDPPVFQAVWERDPDAISKLLQYGANPSAKRKDGDPVLHYAIWCGQLPVIETLLQAGAGPDQQDEDGAPAMFAAVRSGKPEIVKLLIQYGAKLNARNKRGDTPLHSAVWYGKPEVVETLLLAGADPNQADASGETALHDAAWRRQVALARLLLEFNASRTQKDKNGVTPLDRANKSGNAELVRLFNEEKIQVRKSVAVQQLKPQPPQQLKPQPPEIAKPQPFTPPVIRRKPDAVFGDDRFSSGPGQAIVYSPNSRQLIAGDEDGSIRFFDAQSGQLKNVIAAHQDSVQGLAFIPGSHILVSASAGSEIKFWNIDTGAELLRLHNAHWGQGKALAVSSDGRWLSTGWDVWRIKSIQPLELAPEGRRVISPERRVGVLWSFFTPGSRYLVLSRNFAGIWVWDLEKDTLKPVAALNQKTVKEIRWKDLAGVADKGQAAGEDLLAIATDQYTLLTGNAKDLSVAARHLKHVAPSARALAYSGNGQFLASTGYGSRLKIFDIENNRMMPFGGHTAAVLAVAASPDGKLIASGGNDKTVRIWQRKSQKLLQEIPIGDYVYSLCFAAGGDVLAVGDNGGKVHLWDMQKKTRRTLATSGRVTDLAWHAGSNTLFSLGFEIAAIDVEQHEIKARISAIESQQGTLAVSPDGRLIVGSARTMAAGETYKLPPAWTLDGGELIPLKDVFNRAMSHSYMINAVAFSPDSRLMASSSQGAIQLCDIRTRKPVTGKMCGHQYSISNLRFSPDGKWLASSSWDGTARLWSVATGQQKFVFDADAGRVSWVCFTPAGDLVTANWNGTVHLWELP